ncbi:hypothetical protein HNQ60_005364 [Povalibacter uvarum]|uniref:DUF7832 domain-containing protein n=1 Tax=Povalibacter uvarum TaxID=732238 RepID=A0A841HWW1_9GAMM|nr:hypothetical protein [Povalibacter uvarum]MBB6096442.1 hypothetical protein [Povalibacter uvarum]
MKYDDASWHYGGKFPADLPPEAGATHTGMFVAWALLAGLGGDIHTEECPEDLELAQSRSETPGTLFLRFCDGKFTDEDLNDEGNQFAAAYFDFENGSYLADYAATLGEAGRDLYYVADTWENFDRLRPVLDERLSEWRAAHG